MQIWNSIQGIQDYLSKCWLNYLSKFETETAKMRCHHFGPFVLSTVWNKTSGTLQVIYLFIVLYLIVELFELIVASIDFL